MKRAIKKIGKLLRSGKKFFWLFKKKTTIWMIGDSTLCKYDKGFAHLTGWGMPFADYFNDETIVKNRARSGYSTKTFIEQGLWKAITMRLKKDDFVLIQFGHNDENTEAIHIYTSPKDYGINLLQFIKEAKAKKAFPILITPVARRAFNEDGELMDTHFNYANTVRHIAEQENIPLIDLDNISRNTFQKLGDEHSKMLFNYLLPNENPNYSKGIEDDTHFNEFGARKIAQLVLAEIKKQQLILADVIVQNNN